LFLETMMDTPIVRRWKSILAALLLIGMLVPLKEGRGMQLIRPRFRLLTIDWRRLTAMLLALAGLIMAALAWIGYSYTARTEPLVVAAIAIPAGTRITPDMLTIVQAPLARPAALHGLSDPTPLIGTYTRVQLSPNQLRGRPSASTPVDYAF
jgi:SAF domain